MEYTTLQVERDGEVEVLTLNRPERMNGITGTMVHELAHYWTAKAADASTRVVVMRGAGRAFCAGLDIKEQSADGDRPTFRPGEPTLSDLPPLMRRAPQPIIALLHGGVSGGGFAMALAADFRFAADTLKMNDAFARIGMSGCEMGVSYFLPRLVGVPVARELIYTGRYVDAERALAIGLVSGVASEEKLRDEAQPLIDDLLAVSPTGLRESKRTLNASLGMDDLEAVIDLEIGAQQRCQQTGDFDEAITAFVEKRPPRFRPLTRTGG
ncbi:MAG: enoyl-CoA hydratase-related protein [Actinomycetota bacterium]|nr:enoyl-CoA hydratase-related protein [Actinomycetota bacterium]